MFGEQCYAFTGIHPLPKDDLTMNQLLAPAFTATALPLTRRAL